MSELTEEENALLERLKPLVKEFLETRTEVDIDNGVGSYVVSQKGNLYHGVPFGAARWIHGEENAIGNMITKEGVDARIKTIVIVGGGNEACMPCGMCRIAIYRYGTEQIAILAANLEFSAVKKFSISELYPHPWKGED
jgi:cytidine deaminase